ncbi:hypothetical protein [Mycoplasmopsis cynos]|uniref:ATP-dependent protease La n=1 Tax=Mycoplasmopsis cynos TaxID=171284 RepID=A0A449AH08_9BACT|nr:hypothetical protein [Mycoplasmopsis cynos]VEU64272.1 ATP-dependent protease La [Mycoplasmopsis cynos]
MKNNIEKIIENLIMHNTLLIIQILLAKTEKKLKYLNLFQIKIKNVKDELINLILNLMNSIMASKVQLLI